ncbi:UDP-3-O-[3-hydroxymyristoyl] N-acetylglucosamine deacetylase [bacterium]|nr:UDP-3-O-[3-hydroxymyristoyl] N-acetylglucosamine deacetylase [bacterium]
MKPRQKTIQKPVERQGIGLNLGQPVVLRLSPAPVNAGVVFVRTDLDGAPAVPAALDYVVPRERRTVLRNGEAEVQMTEHLLAAVAGFDIDNLTVELDGPELPGGDGSAMIFVEMFEEAGVETQDATRRQLTLRKPITLGEESNTMLALPASEGLSVAYTLDYADGRLPTQHVDVEITRDAFVRELAPARTFVFEAEATALLEAGFGGGANTDNVLVIREDGSVLGNALRFPDEFARHKALDLLGDLRLAGPGLLAHILAIKSGHADTQDLLKRVVRAASSPDDLGLDIHDILSVVPHRYPMLLIDRVVQIEAGRRATAIKNVSINEPFFTGHFPENPIMPGVLIIECMAQASGLLLYQRRADAHTIAHLMAVDEAKFRRPVVPGDQLRIEVEALHMKKRTCRVRAKALVEDTLAAEAIITFILVDTEPKD